MVVHSNEVDEEGGRAGEARNEERSYHHLLDPVLAYKKKHKIVKKNGVQKYNYYQL